jgi:hypothetical protein
MGIKDTLAKVMYGKKLKQVDEITSLLREFYSRRHVLGGIGQVETMLSEVDPRLVGLLARQIEYGTTGELDYCNDRIRLGVVEDSRRANVWDPVVGSAIDIWTNFGFGTQVEVIPTDEQAQEVWSEFWTAPRNDYVLGTRSISVLSQEVLTAGELYFTIFTNKVNGQSTIRYIETEEITNIITSPFDKSVPVFYVRNYAPNNGQEPTEIYYPDWRLPEEEIEKAWKKINKDGGLKRADKSNDIKLGDFEAGTDVKMIHVAHKVKGVCKHGFPLMTAGLTWSRAYTSFLEDRTAVAKAVAMYVDKISAKGGTRAINTIINNLQSSLVDSSNDYLESNPADVPGSTWVENETMNRTRMPLTTGAGDAEKDGASLLGMAGISANLYLHWLGRGESFRLATASAMEVPIMKSFNRYQLFWSSVWSDISKVVLTQYEKYAGTTFTDGVEAKVNLDPIIQLDIDDVVKIGDMMFELNDRVLLNEEQALLIGKELVQISLGKLGVSNTSDILEAKGADVEFEDDEEDSDTDQDEDTDTDSDSDNDDEVIEFNVPD